MSLDPRIMGLLQEELETLHLERVRHLSSALAQAGHGLTGSGLLHAVDRVLVEEIGRQTDRYLGRVLDRLAGLRVAWTEGVRREVAFLFRERATKDSQWLLGQREMRIPKGEGSGRIDEANSIAARRVEGELDFRVLQQEVLRLPLEELLRAPRYAGVLLHWRQAAEKTESSPSAATETAREAVLAIETLAKLVAGDPNATLGSALSTLRRERVDDAAGLLLNGLEKLWAFSNQVPGLRHGGVPGDPVTVPEAVFVLRTTEGALRYLLSLDLGGDRSNTDENDTQPTPGAG